MHAHGIKLQILVEVDWRPDGRSYSGKDERGWLRQRGHDSGRFLKVRFAMIILPDHDLKKHTVSSRKIIEIGGSIVYSLSLRWSQGGLRTNLAVPLCKEHNAKSTLLFIVWSCPPNPYITARGLPQLLHTRTKDTLPGIAGDSGAQELYSIHSRRPWWSTAAPDGSFR